MKIVEFCKHDYGDEYPNFGPRLSIRRPLTRFEKSHKTQVSALALWQLRSDRSGPASCPVSHVVVESRRLHSPCANLAVDSNAG